MVPMHSFLVSQLCREFQLFTLVGLKSHVRPQLERRVSASFYIHDPGMIRSPRLRGPAYTRPFRSDVLLSVRLVMWR
jgi:hypothetical protein